MKRERKKLLVYTLIVSVVLTLIITLFMSVVPEYYTYVYTPLVFFHICWGEDCLIYMLIENLIIGGIIATLLIYLYSLHKKKK